MILGYCNVVCTVHLETKWFFTPGYAMVKILTQSCELCEILTIILNEIRPFVVDPTYQPPSCIPFREGVNIVVGGILFFCSVII